MRSAIYIVAFVILSIAIAFTIRTTELEKKPAKQIAKVLDMARGLETADMEIIERWEMPEILKEISAITYIDDKRFACVQDEIGMIYIFNISTGQIEKEIPFAGSGDYEGLAIVKNAAYILRADGTIIKLNNYNSSTPQSLEYETHLTTKQDPEGLCYDPKNNRLLVAIKGKDPQGEDYKGIYPFNLNTSVLAKEPAYKIDLKHKAFDRFKVKKRHNLIQPSDIAIHPQTGDLYITEGAKPKILIMDKQGNIKSVKRLKTRDFDQPEGISFSPDGKMFISNEGNAEPGNILELKNL
jgi:uncharacterized protein YjiK